MLPGRIIGWSLVTIVGSIAAVFLTGALMFAIAFVESLAR